MSLELTYTSGSAISPPSRAGVQSERGATMNDRSPYGVEAAMQPTQYGELAMACMPGP